MRPEIPLALLVAAGDRGIPGQLNLANAAYLLSVTLGADKGLGYKPGYKGPYSRAMDSLVQDLLDFGFVTTTQAPSLQRFALSPDVGRTVTKLMLGFKKEWDAADRLASVLRDKLNWNEEAVAAIARAVFIVRNWGPGFGEPNQISTKARTFGWITSKELLLENRPIIQEIGR